MMSNEVELYRKFLDKTKQLLYRSLNEYRINLLKMIASIEANDLYSLVDKHTLSSVIKIELENVHQQIKTITEATKQTLPQNWI
jgi:hypothetical protein